MTAARARTSSSTSRDTAIVFSGTVLALLASLGTQSCLGWFLDPAARGAFAVCVTFASVAAVVFGVASDRAVQYHVIARTFSVGRATVLAYVTTLASAAFAAAACWVLIGTPHPYFAKADPASFRWALLLIPLIGLTNALSLLLAGMGRFAAMGALNVLANVANLVLTLLLVGLLGFGVNGAIWALALAYALAILLRSRAVWEDAGGLEWPRLADLARVASYGVRYYVARVGNVTNTQIGMIVMAWVAPPAEIGLFAAASALIGRITVIPESISTALMPRVGPAVKGSPELVAAAARATLFGAGGALVALLATSWVVVPILLSSAYSGAVILLWLMAPGIWLKSAARPLTSYFLGVDRPGLVSFSTGLELAANLVALPLFYRRFGLAGAAAATSVGGGLASLLLIAAFHAVSGVGPGRAWRPRRADLARLLDLRRRVAGRGVHMRASVRVREDPPRFRRLEILADRVVKHRRPELIAIEAQKTARAAEIGTATGLFRAPVVLEVDVENGWMATERIDGLVPVHDVLLRTRNDAPVVAAGRALAAIHAGLTLPPAMRSPLPLPWAAPEAGVDVALHGDFNTRNVFVRAGTDELVIADWETSLRICALDEQAFHQIPTMGPRYFDLAWFIASLFGRTWFGLHRIRDAAGCSEAFLRSYFLHAGPDARPEGFARYLVRFADPVQGLEAARRGPWLDRLLHPRSRIVVSCGALRTFARSLAADLPEAVGPPALDA